MKVSLMNNNWADFNMTSTPKDKDCLTKIEFNNN